MLATFLFLSLCSMRAVPCFRVWRLWWAGRSHNVQRGNLVSMVGVPWFGSWLLAAVVSRRGAQLLARPDVFKQLVVLSEHSAVQALPRGESRLVVASPVEGPHCGLIPFGQPCDRIVTSGLQWNLSGQRLSADSLVRLSSLEACGAWVLRQLSCAGELLQQTC